MANASDIARRLMSDLQRDFGLTPAQAAGVVGNLRHESDNFRGLQEYNPTVPGSRGGYGYAQWTGSRREAFEDYAKENRLDPSSYDANYGFMKHEIETDRFVGNNFMKVKQARTVEEAARIISDEYLRPGIPHNDQRIRLAQQTLELPPMPPGELPQVATQLDVAPRPRVASAEINTLRNPPALPRSRSDALDAINAATGAQSGPQMAYAPSGGAMPSVMPPPPRVRPQTAPASIFADTRSLIEQANPRQPTNPRQPRAADLGLTERTSATPHLRTNGRGIVDPAQIVYGAEMAQDIFPALNGPQTRVAAAPERSAAEMADLYRNGGPTRPGAASRSVADVAELYRDGGPTRPPSRTPPRPRPIADAVIARTNAGLSRPGASQPRAVDLAMLDTNDMTPQIGPDGRGAYSPQLPMNADNFSGGLASLTPNAASLRRPGPREAPIPAQMSTQLAALRAPSEAWQTVASLPTTQPERSITEVADLYKHGGPTRPGAQRRTVADVADIYQHGGPTRPYQPYVPGPDGYTNNDKDVARLAPDVMPEGRAMQPPAPGDTVLMGVGGKEVMRPIPFRQSSALAALRGSTHPILHEDPMGGGDPIEEPQAAPTRTRSSNALQPPPVAAPQPQPSFGVAAGYIWAKDRSGEWTKVGKVGASTPAAAMRPSLFSGSSPAPTRYTPANSPSLEDRITGRATSSGGGASSLVG